MKELNGKSILVGKEPGSGKLRVALKSNGKYKVGTIPMEVSACVSRCMPEKESAHCRIDIDQAGGMRITNLKPENVTYVNGVEVQSKKVNPDSDVALGNDRFAISLVAVLEMAKHLESMPETAPAAAAQAQAAPPAANREPAPAFAIDHLKLVWDEYHQHQIDIRKRQKNQNLIRTVASIFTIGGGSVSALVARHGGADWLTSGLGLLSGLGLIILIMSFIMGARDKSIEEGEEATEKFQTDYICPNPKCRHFLGNIPYRILKQNTGCQYCRCRFTKED